MGMNVNRLALSSGQMETIQARLNDIITHRWRKLHRSTTKYWWPIHIIQGPPWAFLRQSASSRDLRKKRAASIGVRVKLTKSDTRMAKATVTP